MTGGLAVILGSTGRNLGAGMSGGIAYVHSLDPNKVNADSLGSGELRLEKLGSADAEILKDILESHLAETGSPRASALLDQFEKTVDEFTKVVPRDYAAVLEVRQEAENAGIDPDGDATWKKIMEVTGG